MDDPNITVTEFVRGLTQHDIGKPFAQQNWRHARLGYWLLWRAGFQAEALLALRHDKNVRNHYFRSKGAAVSIPAVTMLAYALDHLAAAVYSFQPDPGQTLWHAWQNPFSRLPAQIQVKNVPSHFVVGADTQSASNQALAAYEDKLWETFVSTLPRPWQEQLTLEAKAEIENKKMPLPVDPTSWAKGEIALEKLLQALDIYPERTYPPMNDTSLRKHGRLTGILGFVVYRNLEQDPQIDVHESMAQNYRGDYLNHEALVRNHLTAHLFRITFTGVETLAQQAERVDDLHGALTLAAYFREAFKCALAEQWDVPDLAEWLAVSESQFDLVYLLPGEAATLQARVDAAYHQTIQQIVQRIMQGRLQRDFPGIGVQERDLIQQFSTFAYSLHILPVPVPEGASFDDFAATYGRNVLAAYVQSQQDARAAMPSIMPDMRASLSAEDTCEVCGNHPVLEPPPDLDADTRERWLEKRAYAAHTFREARERLCLSCIARRTLAYGDVAKRMDPLVHQMLQPVPGKTHRWQRVPEVPEGLPPLPPSLSTTVQLDDPNAMYDIGAFYARLRRGNQQELDLFPTTTYAADRYGNVVLLSLSPTHALYDTYVYIRALDEWKARELSAEAVIRDWQRTFVDFYKKQEEDNLAFAQSIAKVEPHLARVMERIAWIKRFYEALEDALITAKIRVLPLDVEFPTVRLLVPADQLHDVLHILDDTVTTTLFSADAPADLQAREALHTLLKLLVPNLLHGTVILFKHKFPLYLALEAERDLFSKLAAHDHEKPSEAQEGPSTTGWYGVRLALSDLRGTLSETGPLHATATYGNLGHILDLVQQVDRATIEQLAASTAYHTADFAEAQALVRANRLARTPRAAVKKLTQDEDLFKAVYFITRAIRR